MQVLPEDSEQHLSIEVATTVAELESLRPDYERLHAVTLDNSPFTLYEWHRTWCTYFLNLDPHVKDELRVFVLRNARSECVAIVPFFASRRRLGPLQIVSVDLLGADPSTTELRAPLIAPGYESATVHRVRAELSLKGDWDWITWGDVPEALNRALESRTAIPAPQRAPGYLLDLPPNWEQFRAGLKRNIRESLRHCYNSLKREGLAFTFEIGKAPQDVKPGIARFLELHAKRAGMTGTVPHPDHFASDVSRKFLFAVCERLAERGAVRIFQFRIGGDVVAVRIGFVIGECLHMYYSGFDPAWARYGVMTTALAESLKYAIGENLKTVNLSRGTDPSKTRWGPRSVRYTEVRELRPRIKSRIAHRAYVSVRSGTGLPSWILRRLGKGRRAWEASDAELT